MSEVRARDFRPLIAKWKNVPNLPSGTTVSVLIFDHSWRHIINGHMRPGINSVAEPWDAWLPANLVEDLKSTCFGNLPLDLAYVEATRLLESEVRKSLSVPWLIALSPIRVGTGLTTWILVLPSGFLAVFRSRSIDPNASFELKTCYCVDEAVGEPDTVERITETIRYLVQKYCELSDPQCPAKRIRSVDEVTGARICDQKLLLHTRETWGFRKVGMRVRWASHHLSDALKKIFPEQNSKDAFDSTGGSPLT